MNTIRIGEVLMRRGSLSEAQVNAVLLEQERSHRPFGEIAENMYGIDPTDIEQAWVEQYASLTRHIDVSGVEVEARALGCIDRRQAWQFRVVPVGFDGRELMVATSPDNLCRALRFVTRCVSEPCYLVLTEAASLGRALERLFPMPGMSAEVALESRLSPLALLADD